MIDKHQYFYRFFSNYQCKRQLSVTSAANVRAGRQTQPLSSALPNIQEVQTDTNDIDIAKTKGLI